MKSFLNFILEAEEKDKESKGFFIDKDGYANPEQPITIRPAKNKKPKKKAINEDSLSGKYKDTLNNLPGQHPKLKRSDFSSKEDYHKHFDARNDHHTEISKKLHSTQVPPTKTQKDHIRDYTEGEEGGIYSQELNHALIQNHKNSKPETEGMDSHVKKIHNTISKLTKHPIGHQVHLYSGVGFNPKAAAKKSKDGIIHLPGHISTTHDIETAKSFADSSWFNDNTNGRHIIHIDAKPSDKGYHVDKYSAHHGENETVIPAKTKLKYSDSTMARDAWGTKYHIHHFTIHSQE